MQILFPAKTLLPAVGQLVASGPCRNSGDKPTDPDKNVLNDDRYPTTQFTGISETGFELAAYISGSTHKI